MSLSAQERERDERAKNPSPLGGAHFSSCAEPSNARADRWICFFALFLYLTHAYMCAFVYKSVSNLRFSFGSLVAVAARALFGGRFAVVLGVLLLLLLLKVVLPLFHVDDAAVGLLHHLGHRFQQVCDFSGGNNAHAICFQLVQRHR
jgi:uncharacterized membrane protein